MASLPHHCNTSKRGGNRRVQLLLLCLMLKITSTMSFKDNSSLASQKAELWEETEDTFSLLDAEH